MKDCSHILTLIDVYLDDEATAETNAMVHEHIELCEACARQLQAARRLRASMRDALAHERAPASLHQRVRAIAQPPSSLASLIRTWAGPAVATAIVAWVVVTWRPAEPEIEIASAVGEHVSCALERTQPTRTTALAGLHLAESSMPLIPSAGGQVRVLDAHICGRQRDYQHIVLEEGGTKASILIASAGEGAERTLPPQRRGDFEVSVIRSTRHRTFVVIDRTRSQALREWREPAVERVRSFLKQREGP